MGDGWVVRGWVKVWVAIGIRWEEGFGDEGLMVLWG